MVSTCGLCGRETSTCDTPPPPDYMPCTRTAGHPGPCAMPARYPDEGDLLEILESMRASVQRIARLTIFGLAGIAVIAVVDAVATYDWHTVVSRLHG